MTHDTGLANGAVVGLIAVLILGLTSLLLGIALLIAPAVTAGCGLPHPTTEQTADAAAPPTEASHTTSAGHGPGPAPSVGTDAAAQTSLPPDAAGCLHLGGLPSPPRAIAADASGLVADLTGTGGLVTAATAHLVAETRAAFPASRWTCWSPRPGTTSEHPLGRACDVTFGNAIGVFPDAQAVAEGWRMVSWLQQHAATLQVTYLIWQGHIWSLARADEGWRPYGGGGIHDPTSPTGGHYDHVHITVDP